MSIPPPALIRKTIESYRLVIQFLDRWAAALEEDTVRRLGVDYYQNHVLLSASVKLHRAGAEWPSFLAHQICKEWLSENNGRTWEDLFTGFVYHQLNVQLVDGQYRIVPAGFSGKSRCKFLVDNQYLRCAVQPTRKDCTDCTDHIPI